jgi:hypothetical protein
MIDVTDLLATIGVCFAVVVIYDHFVNEPEERALEDRIQELERTC